MVSKASMGNNGLCNRLSYLLLFSGEDYVGSLWSLMLSELRVSANNGTERSLCSAFPIMYCDFYARCFG